MSFETIIQQGSFTSTGATKLISIRSDMDWMRVINYSNVGATGDDSVRFYWQRGMADLAGVREFKDGGGNNLNMAAMTTTGFTRIDTSTNPLTAATAVTGATNATRPVVSTGSTAGLTAGDVVLLTGMTGQESLGGIEFQIGTIDPDASFRIENTLATAPGAAATAGFWRKVKWDPIYYPRRRYIANISQATSAVVTTTVDHGLTVGQDVRFIVPAVYGMTQMDGLRGTITAISTLSVGVSLAQLTVDIDSSAFTAFQFPLPAIVPFSQALVVPVGEDTAYALSNNQDILADATENQAVIAMSLPGGDDSPGGSSGDVMYWVAGKSFSVDN